MRCSQKWMVWNGKTAEVPRDGINQMNNSVAFSAWLREREAQQIMRSLPSRTCAKIAPRPAVEALVYNLNGRLKYRKSVMGLVVRRVLRRSKASWHSGPQWKTASFLVRAWRGSAIAAKFLT